MFVQLPVHFDVHRESTADVARSWLHWFAEIPWFAALGYLGALVWAGGKLGWSLLPALSMTLLALVFLFGQFGETYIQARIAHVWQRLYLPPPLPAAPSRQRFWLTALAAALLTVASVLLSRWLFGLDWDTSPLTAGRSPWLVPALAGVGLVIAEVTTARRVRREIRQRCREAFDEEARESSGERA